MRSSIFMAALGIAGIAAAAHAQAKDRTPPVDRAASRVSSPGPAANFIGRVTVQPVITPEPPGRTGVALVAFEPGARSNWHTHPAGQSLYVTKGCGWTQREGGEVMRICEGDAAYVPAGVRHWHGATDKTAMTHLAVNETIDGKNVTWAEPVTDAQYRAGLSAR